MRNSTIDTIRGIAIFIMVLANSMPYIFTDADVFPIRFIFSLAAPTFLFLTGYFIHAQLENKKPYKKLFMRSGYILIAGTLIDLLVWHSIPFQTFDILYLIAISQVVLIGVYQLPRSIQYLLFGSLVVVSTLWYQFYTFDMGLPDVSLTISSIMQLDFGSTLHRFLVDGRFPLLPRICLPYAGYLSHQHKTTLQSRRTLLITIGLILLIVAFVSYMLYPGLANVPREGYLELFYPFQQMYWVFVLGLVVLLNGLFSIKDVSLPILTNSGSQSLLIYISHIIIVAYLFYYSAEPIAFSYPYFIMAIGFWLFFLVSLHYLSQTTKLLTR